MGRRLIQQVACGHARLCPVGFVPPLAENPLSFRLSLDPFSKTIQKHLDVRNIIKFDSLPLERPFIKMDMGVDESRHNQTAFQIEFVCFSAGKVQDFVGAPHGHPSLRHTSSPSGPASRTSAL